MELKVPVCIFTGGHGYNENWPTFRTLICPHFYKYKHQEKNHACLF